MKYLVSNENIVLVANDVNMSIFNPLWLLKNNILNEEELQNASPLTVTPVMVQIGTKEFELVVLPNRIQFNIRPGTKEVTASLNRVIGGIVRTLPHTPYSAVGMNFNYIAKPVSEENFATWNQTWFESVLTSNVEKLRESNPRFGCYFSFDFMDTRAKVDLKPARLNVIRQDSAEQWTIGEEVIKANFNFHKDLVEGQDPVGQILSGFESWEGAKLLSQEILEKSCERGEE